MTPEEKAARLAALDAADAADREAKQNRLDDLTRADFEEEQKRPGLHWGAAAQTAGDLGNVGAQGVSLGYSDEIKAALATALGNTLSGVKVFGEPLMEDPSYETELASEQRKLRDAKVRMNAVTPGSGEGFEVLTSLVGPGALAKKVSQVKNPLLRSGANVGTGAGLGGVSAEGHDRDPLTGMLVGGAGGLIQPFGSVAGSMAPKIGGLTGASAGGWLGSHFGSLPGQIGAVSGGVAGYGLGQGAKTAAQSPGGRNLLAQLATAPGALYDQGSDAVEAGRAKLRQWWDNQ